MLCVVCLDIYRAGTNRNRCTQRLVILRELHAPTNEPQSYVWNQVSLTYFTGEYGPPMKMSVDSRVQAISW